MLDLSTIHKRKANNTNKTYDVQFINVDGTLKSEWQFDYDVTKNESYSSTPYPLVLVIDAPLIFEKCVDHLDGGFAAPAFIHSPEILMILDEDGRDKELPVNQHPLASYFDPPIVGPIILIKEHTRA